MKNYYNILNISSDASAEEIRKAFRKLALKHHPDKTNNDPLAAAQFRLILEAYEVLSNPIERKKYHQKQFSVDFSERSLLQPVQFIDELKNWKNKLQQSDPFRINQQFICYKLLQLFPSEQVNLLIKQPTSYKADLIIYFKDILSLLPFQWQYPLYAKINQIIAGNTNLKNDMDIFLKKQKQLALWYKYQLVVALLFTILVCLLIYCIF